MTLFLTLYGIVAAGVFLYFWLFDDGFFMEDSLVDEAMGTFLCLFLGAFWGAYALGAAVIVPFLLLRRLLRFLLGRRI